MSWCCCSSVETTYNTEFEENARYCSSSDFYANLLDSSDSRNELLGSAETPVTKKIMDYIARRQGHEAILVVLADLVNSPSCVAILAP